MHLAKQVVFLGNHQRQEGGLITRHIAEARRALRALTRSPGFAIVAVLSLGVATALNTTVYSLLDAMVNPAIAVHDAEQLRGIRVYGDTHRRLTTAILDAAFRDGLHGYEGATGYLALGDHVTVEHGSRARDASGVATRADFFSVLGAHAIKGRVFAPTDDGEPLAVISDRLAAELFPDGEPVIGASVDIDGHPRTLVGVVRRDVGFGPLDHDVWILPTDVRSAVPPTLIRLRQGVDPKSAAPELTVIAARLAASIGVDPSTVAIVLGKPTVRPFHAGPLHWALVASALAILLVACGNLANLQLAHGLGRSDLAVRSALGATRRQLAAMLMWENCILAAAGLVVGLILALWAADALRAFIPPQVAEYIVAPRTNWRMVPAAVGAAVIALLVAGLLPAWRISRVDPNRLLSHRAGTGSHRKHRRIYAGLIAVQIALGLPLLSGAGLMARSAWRLESTSYVIHHYVGFDPGPIVVANARMSAVTVGTVRLDSVANSIESRLRTVRGVSDVAVRFSIAPAGKAVTAEGNDRLYREVPAAMWSPDVVSASYFRTLGRFLTRGREPSDGGLEGQVVVDEPTTWFLWPSGDPIGRRIKFGDFRSSEPWARVVGVVGDARDTATMRIADPALGYHLGTAYRTFTPSDLAPHSKDGYSLLVYVRTRGSTSQTAVDVRHALWATPGILSSRVESADDHYGLSLHRSSERFVASIFSLFAVLGVGLAMMGVFGIVAYSVNERRREFAVRISLGATTRDVLRDVLREGLLLVLIGTAAGLLLTRRSTPWLAMFMTGMNDLYDAPFFAALALALASAVFVAALVPAMRATRADPIAALRSE